MNRTASLRTARTASSVAPVLLALAAVGCSQSSADSAGGAEGGKTSPAPPMNDQERSAGRASAERAIAEADVVQLAGGKLYALSKLGTLSIVDVSAPSRLVLLGQAYLPGEPFEMYLRGDLLVVMTNGAYAVTGQSNERPPPSQARQGAVEDATAVDRTTGSGVIVIDVKDPAILRRVAAFPVGGEIADSRVVGDILYLATFENAACWQCSTEARTVVTTFDIASPATMRKVDQIEFASDERGMSWGADDWKRSIVVTPERMYVGGHAAGDAYSYSSQTGGEGTIDVLDITDPSGKLVKGAHIETTGVIRSRWQMDESNGVLRVVSQRGAWSTNGVGDPEVQTFYIWNTGSLQEMGKTNIQMPRQEGLKSVRFDGNRAYAITFAETDPLFIVDLTNPSKPQQRGELVMPGWVFHLEPHGDRLLGLGLDRRDPAGHLNVSLFDVADMDHPRMLQRVSFGATGATRDDMILDYEMPEDQDRIQKAFRVLDDGLIVVPYSGSTSYSPDSSSCSAMGGGIQLIAWQQDVLTKQASLPMAGNPRRALVAEQGGRELVGVSDSNVTKFDLSRRDVAAKTADLVIGPCETRPNSLGGGVGWGESNNRMQREYVDGGLFFCAASSGGTRGAWWTGLALGLAAIGGAIRRRAQ